MIIDAIHIYTKDYSTSTKIVELSLNKADLTQPYILQGATGLDSADFMPQFFGTSNSGAIRYYNMQPQSREVALSILLNPQGTGVSYSSLRDALYKAISSSLVSNVELRFMLSTTEKARLTGIITKFESDLFSLVPAVQLTISCPDPLLKDPISTSALTGLDKVNPVITDADSTAPHGFTMQITLAATVAKVIFQKSPQWYFTVTPPPASLFASGDILNFSSVQNNKYFYMTRTGVRTDYVDKVGVGSTWPMIFPGSNTFTISMENPIGTALASTAWTITSFDYNKTYWGV